MLVYIFNAPKPDDGETLEPQALSNWETITTLLWPHPQFDVRRYV